MEYLIKWKNYPESDNTWEGQENIFATELLEEFERNQKKSRSSRNNKSNGKSVYVDDSDSDGADYSGTVEKVVRPVSSPPSQLKQAETTEGNGRVWEMPQIDDHTLQNEKAEQGLGLWGMRECFSRPFWPVSRTPAYTVTNRIRRPGSVIAVTCGTIQPVRKRTKWKRLTRAGKRPRVMTTARNVWVVVVDGGDGNRTTEPRWGKLRRSFLSARLRMEHNSISSNGKISLISKIHGSHAGGSTASAGGNWSISIRGAGILFGFNVSGLMGWTRKRRRGYWPTWSAMSGVKWTAL